MTARDSQRSKVYAAEEFVRTLFDRASERGNRAVEFFETQLTLPPEGRFASAPAVQRYVDDVLAQARAEVVYAAGPASTLFAVARAAEAAGAWSQTALERPMTCGTGLCQGCAVPVVGEDGVTRPVRACTEGPVLRGDRVRWDELAEVE